MDAALARATSLACWSDLPVDIVPTTDVVESLGLGDGRTNLNFIATAKAGGQRYFIRIGADLPPWGVTRVKEQAAARAVAASGVGAAVIHAEQDGIPALVTSFVAGRALTGAQVHAALTGGDDALLDALAATLRKVHATPIPAELASVAPAAPAWAPPDLPRWIAYARAGGFSRLPGLLGDADALVAEVEALAGPLAEGSARFCHFDLLPDNFVVDTAAAGAPAVTVVDFEYCNAGQPLMDLAIMAMGCELDAAQEATLLARYLGLPSLPEAEAGRFRGLKVLATLRETLWGVVAEVSGQSALSPADAAAYTDANYLKFQAARASFEAARS